MIELISSGLKPGSANAYARSVNSFLTWLFENEHTTTHLKIPLTSVKERVLQTYKPEDIHKIITYKPSSHTRKRLIAILFLLIDSVNLRRAGAHDPASAPKVHASSTGSRLLRPVLPPASSHWRIAAPQMRGSEPM
jgi:hypothetical protein